MSFRLYPSGPGDTWATSFHTEEAANEAFWRKREKWGAADFESGDLWSQLLPLKSVKRYDVTEIPITVAAMSMYTLAGVVYTIFFPLLPRSRL